MNTVLLRLCAAILFGMFLTPRVLIAQGTAFSYQGRLLESGAAASGQYDMTFAVFDALSGGNQIGSTLNGASVIVSNGLFMVTLDFGSGVFPGAQRWLEIGVRTNGSSAYAVGASEN